VFEMMVIHVMPLPEHVISLMYPHNRCEIFVDAASMKSVAIAVACDFVVVEDNTTGVKFLMAPPMSAKF